MKKIKQSKFEVSEVRWHCKKCGRVNSHCHVPWHDDIVVCGSCGKKYRVVED